jgi:hypothetical protein
MDAMSAFRLKVASGAVVVVRYEVDSEALDPGDGELRFVPTSRRTWVHVPLDDGRTLLVNAYDVVIAP